MFSATIPHRIEKMSKKMMDNPLFICIGEVLALAVNGAFYH